MKTNLSELTNQDQELFRQFVDRYRLQYNCNFEDSWTYILQSTRSWPRKYLTEDTLILLTRRDDKTLVIPNYFTPSDTHLIEFIKSLGESVILKNVSLRDVERLKQLGFDEYQKGEEWNEDAPYDDQTFPQQVICLEDLLKLKGKKYSNLRRDLNRSRATTPRLSLREYQPELDKSKVVELTQAQEERNQGTFNAHKKYFDIETNQNLTPLIFETSRIIGFTLFNRISEQCVAMNAFIYDFSIPCLCARIAFESAKIAAELGYRFANLQGSETAGLDRWKRKFNPLKSIEKTHLVYRP